MYTAVKFIKLILNVFALIIMILFIFTTFTPVYNPNEENSNLHNAQAGILPFYLNEKDIAYISNKGMSDAAREAVLERAKAMAEVKWIPQYNLVDKKGHYVFRKGRTYYGVPYSMDSYQVTSPNDFLNKIKDSKIIYGNDCSGFVSAAWGINRQTTLSIYNAVKNGSKIEKKFIRKISWDEIRPADALLLEKGNAKGHIMLFIDVDKKNSDNLNVYEQNIQTVIPLETIPAARKDVRSKSMLMKEGYIPIRLMESK